MAEAWQANHETAVATLTAARAEGRDPAHGGEAARKRGQAISQHHRDRKAWRARHGKDDGDEAAFRREILPALADVPVHQIIEATGLTDAYCRQIRSGKRVPHPRHWKVLKQLAEEESG